MKSPFPGMDPYIEDCGLFEDFHNNLIHEIHASLAARVPNRYVVRTGERAYVVLAESEGQKAHSILPDVGVLRPSNAHSTTASVALATPNVETDAVSMRAFVSTEYRESFIEIHSLEPERDLVTCIEVLSPSNKRRKSKGRKIYLRKRQAMLMGFAHFVEIDLLRGGDRMPMIDPWPNSPYTLLVARGVYAPQRKVWPAHFKRPLPALPIPLIHPDPDIQLELQPLIETIYARSCYNRDIDYARPLSAPLSDDEAKWLAEQLRQRAEPSPPNVNAG